MALIKFGGGVVQMTGSIAGTTFARNRYGNYARARTKPINPNSARQQVVRAALAFLTDRWQGTVTALQRAAWDLYGANVVMTNRLGESINLSGFNHYLRSNMIRKQTSQAIIDAGPVVFEIPEEDPTVTVTATEAAQTFDFNFDNTLPWALENGGLQFIFQGLPQNPQRNFFDGPWRMAGVTVGVDPGGPATPHVRPVQYAIAELQKLWVYARISRLDGRLSNPFRCDCFVGA